MHEANNTVGANPRTLDRFLSRSEVMIALSVCEVMDIMKAAQRG
jgi:hypothetical protein